MEKDKCKRCGKEREEAALHPDWCIKCFNEEWKEMFKRQKGKDFKWI